MPCKHEGGTGVCNRNRSGACRAYQKEYRAGVHSGSAVRGEHVGKMTAACELFVRADCSRRGYEVTVPVSPTAKHDLHVEFPSVGWKGVQVKAARFNTMSGNLNTYNGRRGSKSPILALVYLPTNRIEYRAGTEPLPKELL